MNLDELAAKQGGYYSKPVILAGSVSKPLARIAYFNRPENAIGVEIRGEATLFVGTALPN